MKNRNRGQRLLIFLGLAILIMLLIDRIYPGWFPAPATQSQETTQTGFFKAFPEAQASEMTKLASVKPLKVEPSFDIIFHPKLPEEKFMPFQDWVLDKGLDLGEELLETARRIDANKAYHPSGPEKSSAQKEMKQLDTPNLMQDAAFTMPESPPWIKYSASAGKETGKPKIVLIIDDLGLHKNLTQQFIDLKGPITLAFLPHAPSLQSMIDQARANNHEAMIHMPMEPLKASIDPGPMALMKDMSQKEIIHALEHNLAQAKGYVGINNHMGSKFTQDPQAMDSVMRILRKRGLLFVDSRTINSSVALEYARLNQVPSQTRDVFIDHYPTVDFIEKSLRIVEKKAKRKGYAIAIGHPYPQTLETLKDWMEGLDDKGFELAPVTSVIDIPETQTVEYYDRAKLINASVSAP